MLTCCFAINPRVENTANPERKLAQLFTPESTKASLKIPISNLMQNFIKTWGGNLTFIASLISICNQGWKVMLFKSKDESILIIYIKSKEFSILDIRNKKQRLKIT